MNTKDFYLNISEGFRLHVTSRQCQRPADLYSLEFTQEILTDGEVTSTSTYNFFLTKSDIKTLCRELANE
jgi:hypothetical protein